MSEELKKLTETLRRHVWCIIILALLFVFWLTAFFYAGKGNDIASWLSIILAILVIVYMFYQNARSEQNTSEMRGLIHRGQQIIEEKAGVMTDEARVMRETGLALIEKFQPEVGGESEPFEGPSFQFDVSSVGKGLLLVLYCIAKSCERQKRIYFKEIMPLIFEEDELDSTENAVDSTIAYSVTSVLSCLFEPESIIFHDVSEREFPQIEVKNLPANFAKYVSDEIKKRIKNPSTKPENKSFYQDAVQAVDDYFKG